MEVLGNTKSPTRRVLLIHSWWGLTRSFRDYGERLSGEGYTVGLSDLFAGKTASGVEDAKRLRRMPRKEPMYRYLISNIEDLLSVGDSWVRTVDLVGFSMGGHWAVWLSQQPDLPVRSTVLYYAARAGSYAHSKASFLAHFAENDPWVSKTVRRNMERAISSAGCAYQSFDYPETSHWFAETDRPEEYDAGSAELAFQRTVAHLASS
ncbi:dienelactone hydrolase family protein [Hoeflea halophila]|nr:dienelactone hydrolase family protein [Hoeflea halophila]